MLDPWHILKATKPKIPGTKEFQSEMTNQIMNLIVERNMDDYIRGKEAMRINPDTRAVIEELDRRRERIFYCEVEDSFIGIRRNNCEVINELIKKDVPQEVRIEELLEKIHVL